MARRESIQYVMARTALADITNDNTARAYKTEIKKFAAFARAQGYKSVDDINRADAKKVIQKYRDEVILPRTSSPNTEHRALAAICKGLGIRRPRSHNDPEWADRIVSTRRTSNTITRGRIQAANKQGRKEMDLDKYQRLVSLQSVTGIRRAELSKLRGRDLVRDESGYLCIQVIRGKGGKNQLQRILPEDVPRVKDFFTGIGPDQKVFTKEEMQNHINLHGLRAVQAKKAYAYYAEQVKTDSGRGQLIAEIKKRFDAFHGDGPGKNRFLEELKKCENAETYTLRGANKQKAVDLGLPVKYDRAALLAVSVYHLSHWRLDVTVTNYLIQ